MPIFIEFGHSPKGDTWLKLRSPLPDSRQVTMPITRERWSAINLRVQCKFPFTRPTTAREPTSLHKLGQLETTCIPQGGIDLEFIFRGQIIRGSIDPCDSKQGAFADFFFSRPFKLQVVVLAMIREDADNPNASALPCPLTPALSPKGGEGVIWVANLVWNHRCVLARRCHRPPSR